MPRRPSGEASAQVLDQAVDLLGRKLIAPAEAAEDVMLDLAGDLAVLDDVDVLVGLVPVLAAPDGHEHSPPP